MTTVATRHRARRALHQHDPHARDRRGEKADSGHPGTPMALAPLAYTLYTRVMRHNPATRRWPNRDRFVLSSGHASMLLYSIALPLRLRAQLDDIERFRQLGSPCAGHPEYGARARRSRRRPARSARASRCASGWRSPSGCWPRASTATATSSSTTASSRSRSDGDMEEGITSRGRLARRPPRPRPPDRFYDDNHISIEGDTELALQRGRRRALRGLRLARPAPRRRPRARAPRSGARERGRDVNDRPSLIIFRSHIGYGSPNKQDTGERARLAARRGRGPPDEGGLRLADRAALPGPGEALAHCRDPIGRAARLRSANGRQRFDVYRPTHPQQAAGCEAIFDRRAPKLPAGQLKRFEPATKIATRKASQESIQVAAEHVPWLVGGSADLAPSTLTLIETPRASRARTTAAQPPLRHPRARDGRDRQRPLLPACAAYGATFLIFSDYMKGAVRLAALMDLPIIFVYTHDSIGLGEDGPPTSRSSSSPPLRARPNINVVRPADANETSLAWSSRAAPDEFTDRVGTFAPGLPISTRRSPTTPSTVGPTS